MRCSPKAAASPACSRRLKGSPQSRMIAKRQIKDFLNPVFFPGFDLELLELLVGKGFHEAAGDLEVGDQRNAEVGGGAADAIAVGQFGALKVFWNVDHEIDIASLDVLDSGVVSPIARPGNFFGFN